MTVSRFTLQDVAREAGVSLATADRVVNRRSGVRAPTVARVEHAIAKLGYRANPAAARLARNQSHRFLFLLPSTANPFMAQLEAQVRATAEWLVPQMAFIDVRHVDVFDPVLLSEALESVPSAYAGVALVALDHPRVRAAIDSLVKRGLPVVTLVSDAPSSGRLHYVGIDNPAAGRTAASLMGRFLAGKQGKIGLIVGSMGLRDHAERCFGFQQVISGEYPGLAVLPVFEGRDNDARNAALVSEILGSHPDVIGLYNAGAGNEGIAQAINRHQRARTLTWIAHELTEGARQWLLSGIAAAIINQDAGHEARSAARILMAQCDNAPILRDQERIRIEIFLRDNMG
ncbi:MAG: LacI family DNA-binding transcriptional regulator [Beijerinckiaceae bacterium]